MCTLRDGNEVRDEGTTHVNYFKIGIRPGADRDRNVTIVATWATLAFSVLLIGGCGKSYDLKTYRCSRLFS